MIRVWNLCEYSLRAALGGMDFEEAMAGADTGPVPL